MGPELDGDYTLLMNFFIIINIISKYTMHMYIYRVRVCSLPIIITDQIYSFILVSIKKPNIT